MNLDDLQTQVSEATKRLSQRFSQAAAERPPKKPPTVESFVTELSPGPIIRDVQDSASSSLVPGPAPDCGDCPPCDCCRQWYSNPVTYTGAACP
jgi:hypothetical protein